MSDNKILWLNVPPWDPEPEERPEPKWRPEPEESGGGDFISRTAHAFHYCCRCKYYRQCKNMPGLSSHLAEHGDMGSVENCPYYRL